MPTRAAKLSPLIVTSVPGTGNPIVMPSLLPIYSPPSPIINILPIIIIVLKLNFTFSFFIVLNPIKEIILNNISDIPPITKIGILESTPPILDTKANPTANTAASLSIEGS